MTRRAVLMLVAAVLAVLPVGLSACDDSFRPPSLAEQRQVQAAVDRQMPGVKADVSSVGSDDVGKPFYQVRLRVGGFRYPVASVVISTNPNGQLQAEPDSTLSYFAMDSRIRNTFAAWYSATVARPQFSELKSLAGVEASRTWQVLQVRQAHALVNGRIGGVPLASIYYLGCGGSPQVTGAFAPTERALQLLLAYDAKAGTWRVLYDLKKGALAR